MKKNTSASSHPAQKRKKTGAIKKRNTTKRAGRNQREVQEARARVTKKNLLIRTQELARTNEQLDQYAHTTSHEFQEPLRKIIVFSKILQQHDKKLSAKKMDEYLRKIEAASLRMSDLIRDMQSFAGVSIYEKLFVDTDLNAIATNIIADFELVIAEKKAKVEVKKLPHIEAVPFQMNQLFYDLIGNALKFSKPEEPPVITISARSLDKKRLKSYPTLNKSLQYVELLFKDEGIGFDQKYASQIFTMFQRLSDGEKYPGTGIGLAMCKKVVETCSGEIFATSALGKGTTILVILPRKQPHLVPEDVSTIEKTWV